MSVDYNMESMWVLKAKIDSDGKRRKKIKPNPKKQSE